MIRGRNANGNRKSTYDSEQEGKNMRKSTYSAVSCILVSKIIRTDRDRKYNPGGKG